jgi:hypothetical protein
MTDLLASDADRERIAERLRPAKRTTASMETGLGAFCTQLGT